VHINLIPFTGLLILLFSIFTSCTSKKEKFTSEQARFDSLKTISATSHTLNGRQVSQAICGSCHMFPEPELLDKHTWKNGVLPHMAVRMGFMTFANNPYAKLSRAEIEAVVKATVFPHEPILDTTTWNKIALFYEQEAPQNPLKQDKKAEIFYTMPAFEIIPKKIPGNLVPLTTLLNFDEKTSHWYIGNRQAILYKLNTQFHVVDTHKLESPPSALTRDLQGNMHILTMGVMDPNDKEAGKIIKSHSSTFDENQLTTLLDSLLRPVHLVINDMNNDGLEDKIVCEFGNYTGRLAWYENKRNSTYTQHILKQKPGARKVLVQDINKDTFPDVVVLMTQGDEGIFAYMNDGKGHFTETILLRFPPVYGSSDFQMIDFNKDGLLDILYSNGDNADYSFSLKNYHGIRLFLNKGNNTFDQKWFYPMHGATQAEACDFDQDGDLDISAIAFFPDFSNAAEEGYLYFENTGNLEFRPHTFPNSSLGRWLTMEIGDFDQDQDIDIAIGSFVFSATPVPPDKKQEWLRNGYHVVILENKSRQPIP
jgi:hypothetical protein